MLVACCDPKCNRPTRVLKPICLIRPPAPVWRSVAGLIRSLSACLSRDPSQFCRAVLLRSCQPMIDATKQLKYCGQNTRERGSGYPEQTSGLGDGEPSASTQFSLMLNPGCTGFFMGRILGRSRSPG